MLLWGFFNEEGANFFKFEIVCNHNSLFSFSLPPYGVLAKKREIVNNDYAGVFLDLPFCPVGRDCTCLVSVVEDFYFCGASKICLMC